MNLILWHRSWNLQKLLDKIQNNSNQMIRVLGAEEYAIMGWDDPNNEKILRQIKEEISASSNTVEFVCGGFPTSNSFHPGKNVTYWTTFWPTKTWYELNKWGHVANNNKFTKAYVNLNNKPWHFRCEMLDQLSKRDLISKGAISWNETNKDYDFKHWKQERLIIDPEYAETTEQYGSFPPAFLESFMSLVNESTMDTIFPTEKTYTPIYFKKPFLVWSVPNFHKALQELGFELYDEVFNYDFDSIPNRTERYNRLLQNFKDLKNHNSTELYEKIQDKIEYNRKHAIKIATQLLYAPDIITETLKIHNTGERVDSLSFEIITQLLPQSINTFIRLHGEL